MSILPEIIEKERTRSPMFSSFFKEFKLNQLFRKCNIHQEKGIPVKEIFPMIFLLARMVLVRRENQKSQWLALLSTDLFLSEEEIVTLYGKRGDIEVFFKMVKSFLKLAREFQVRSYDALVAHTSMVFIRYIMLAVTARRNQDMRTIGDLFLPYVMRSRISPLMEALASLLELLKSTVKPVLLLSEEKIKELLSHFVNSLPAWLREKVILMNCES